MKIQQPQVHLFHWCTGCCQTRQVMITCVSYFVTRDAFVSSYNLLSYSLIIIWICLPQMGRSLPTHRRHMPLYHDWFGVCLHNLLDMDSLGKRNREVLYFRRYYWGCYSAKVTHIRYTASKHSFPMLRRLLVSFMIHFAILTRAQHLSALGKVIIVSLRNRFH